MNNNGCLRSEAGRRCMLVGPDTYAKDPSEVWCFERFDDDNCECQSMGEVLNVGPKSKFALPEGPKSYRFRVVSQAHARVAILLTAL
jgi:hypothetical protein